MKFARAGSVCVGVGSGACFAKVANFLEYRSSGTAEFECLSAPETVNEEPQRSRLDCSSFMGERLAFSSSAIRRRLAFRGVGQLALYSRRWGLQSAIRDWSTEPDGPGSARTAGIFTSTKLSSGAVPRLIHSSQARPSGYQFRWPPPSNCGVKGAPLVAAVRAVEPSSARQKAAVAHMGEVCRHRLAA